MRDDSSYDEKLRRILRETAALFAEQGYEGTGIREISAATGLSLAGLYHYFESKEELLFLIQKESLTSLLQRLDRSLEEHDDPRLRLRTFVRNHLEFFTDRPNEMKILVHETGSLTGHYADTIGELRRAYHRRARRILETIRPENGSDHRTAAFALFGMINWIHTWHPSGEKVEHLTDQMVHLFLQGFGHPASSTRTTALPAGGRVRPSGSS